jgi:hypothetical protein
MHSALKSLLIVAFGVGLVATTAGCEQCEVDSRDGDKEESRQGFCSVDKFIAPARAQGVAYAEGQSVRIVSENGKVVVRRNNAADVNATFDPFVFRAFNTPDSEIDENFTHLETTVTQSGDEIVVKADRVGTHPSTLGAEITVNLPTNFNGQLLVDQDNGSVELNYTASAREIQVQSDNGSIVGEATGPSFTRLITSNGRIRFGLGAADRVEVESGNGGIQFSMGSLLPGARGGFIRTSGLGDIALQAPGSGDYAIVADGDDEVTFAAPPSGCSVEEADATAKTLSCGAAAPRFDVTSNRGGISVTF